MSAWSSTNWIFHMVDIYTFKEYVRTGSRASTGFQLLYKSWLFSCCILQYWNSQNHWNWTSKLNMWKLTQNYLNLYRIIEQHFSPINKICALPKSRVWILYVYMDIHLHTHTRNTQNTYEICLYTSYHLVKILSSHCKVVFCRTEVLITYQ